MPSTGATIGNRIPITYLEIEPASENETAIDAT